MQPRREPRRRRVPALAVALTAASGYAECWLRLRHVVRWTAASTLRRCPPSQVGTTTATTWGGGEGVLPNVCLRAYLVLSVAPPLLGGWPRTHYLKSRHCVCLEGAAVC